MLRPRQKMNRLLVWRSFFILKPCCVFRFSSCLSMSRSCKYQESENMIFIGQQDWWKHSNWLLHTSRNFWASFSYFNYLFVTSYLHLLNILRARFCEFYTICEKVPKHLGYLAKVFFVTEQKSNICDNARFDESFSVWWP